jgi:hypothetical protein
MPYCVAFGCKQKFEKGISFFLFPKDDKFKRIWQHRCGRDRWVVKPRSQLCSRHFEKNQYQRDPEFLQKIGLTGTTNRPRLKLGAVPTKFAHKVWDAGSLELDVFVDDDTKKVG